jgi:hypothetical protein
MAPLLLLAAPNAHAHRPGLSGATLDRDSLVLTFAQPEVAAHAPTGDLTLARTMLTELLVAPVQLEAGGAPCTLGAPVFAYVEQDGIEARVALDCPGALPGAAWRYAPGFLDTFGTAHRHVLETRATFAGGVSKERVGAAMTVLTAEEPTAIWNDAPGRAAEVALAFGKLGVEHIFSGYDHLCFLAGLLLATPKLRDMLLVVTGFTVAHSLTLTAATLGWVRLPATLVEAAIAASIVYVGVENLWQPSPRRRVALTFALGLAHGFGFAGLLAGLGLAGGDLTLPLVSFNLGVEAGQAVLVAVTLPLLLRAQRWERWPRAQRALSVGVAAMGLAWFVARIPGG